MCSAADPVRATNLSSSYSLTSIVNDRIMAAIREIGLTIAMLR